MSAQYLAKSGETVYVSQQLDFEPNGPARL